MNVKITRKPKEAYSFSSSHLPHVLSAAQGNLFLPFPVKPLSADSKPASWLFQMDPASLLTPRTIQLGLAADSKLSSQMYRKPYHKLWEVSASPSSRAAKPTYRGFPEAISNDSPCQMACKTSSRRSYVLFRTPKYLRSH